VTTEPHLNFDPIDRAGELWSQHFGDPTAMKTVTSIMRVQQLLIGALDAQLRSFGITFARYEVLVLLTFSQRGELALSKIVKRLMVHPTSVTNAIDRLEAQGLVKRVPDSSDRRKVLASITDQGRQVTSEATKALNSVSFGIAEQPQEAQQKLYELLRKLRMAAGDFPSPNDPAEH
jgi:DNA-binding MarR family transcriptional regulator